MTLSIISEPVPLNAQPDGAVRIANTRVTLDSVIHAFNDGATAEQIVQAYPVLALADVYAVLGYYLRRTTDVEAYLQTRALEAAQVREAFSHAPIFRGFEPVWKPAEPKQGDKGVLKFAADENLNSNIIRGLLRRNSQLDILRIQDVALSGASDPEVLAWAARDNRCPHHPRRQHNYPLCLRPPPSWATHVRCCGCWSPSISGASHRGPTFDG